MDSEEDVLLEKSVIVQIQNFNIVTEKEETQWENRFNFPLFFIVGLFCFCPISLRAEK